MLEHVPPTPCPPDLAELATLHGVATSYEGSDRTEVLVDAPIVVAVLGMLDVDAASPDAVEASLRSARDAAARAGLPATVVVVAGSGRDLPAPARIVLEDGTTHQVDAVPDDLPLGYHRIVTADQDVALLVVPDRMPEVSRTWGWMLQLYALHSDASWGMGDFGDLAEMARRSGDEQGAGVLLVNPVQAVSPTHPIQRSPYSPASRRFANPLYLRLSDTAAYAAAPDDVRARVDALRPELGPLIDHDAVWDAKLAGLELLWPHRPEDERTRADDELATFATFCAVAERHGGDWRDWPASLQDPDGEAVRQVQVDLADRIGFHAWLQVLCRQQLDAARDAAWAAGMPVGVVHDLPVGVSAGGPDTWSHRDDFAPVVRVGCPADAFNELGQDWGLPPWKPRALAASGYTPFRDVVRSVLRHADGIRIDHVAGLWRLWWIPPGEPAHRGTYVHYDPDAMVGVLMLEAQRAGAIVVGEDLGTVEDVVTDTMHRRGILSSAVLWFERDWDAPGQPHDRPEDWAVEAMASVTTHDLPTASGWLRAEHVRLRASLDLLDGPEDEAYAKAAADKAALLDLLRSEGIAHDDDDTASIVVALHAAIARAGSRLVLSSPSDVVGDLRQPNLPGTIDEYPNWRIPLPVDLDAFFADDGVQQAIEPLRAARAVDHER
ncbi:4-alpha-glucanotransferase [Aeromicrobium stalagmiti]|uniref:4-alpha-glucanotransferase n=1 Tax=Aeromicrobium stalagmiti TaxID=2738988 RepID=UPI00156A25B0|nr:4-alpha-glucanotransferase [Aeromicrobium stalagmiti]NRQ50111.1 4-alpha-glucanotransferase [Aeromicrobium stalagmiti]